ncbi:MAG: CapA family protein, partial [Lachnospiraceae bacterium]|nr:CapA family protein [Lachnospiraceae bacterium]
VCHHPHVPMNYEKVGDKYIFYSLGNFIFDTPYQRSQYYTESGVVLKLSFDENGYDFEALGIKVDRESERVVSAPLPDIFTEVPEEEYKKLAPLSAKAFVAATKRQQIFMYSDRYSASTTEEEWHENFWNEKRSGRVPGEALDFQIVCPLADEAEKGEWKSSVLDDVRDHILKMM